MIRVPEDLPNHPQIVFLLKLKRSMTIQYIEWWCSAHGVDL